jgi:DNA-binding MarR family transcriptional regulator
VHPQPPAKPSEPRARRSPGSRNAADPAAALIALRRIVRYLRLADREVEVACRLSAAQLFVLHTLVETAGLSLAELADRTLTDQSSVSTVVARLVERGLVTRRVSTIDRRRAELRLTAAGHRMVQRAPHAPQAQIIAAIHAMPAARRGELVRALEGLVTAIGANAVAPRMLFEDEPPRTRRKRPRSTATLPQ